MHELDAGKFKTSHREKNVFAKFTMAGTQKVSTQVRGARANNPEQKWPVMTENMLRFPANPVRAD